MGALDEISSRCRCIVADGGRNVEGIIREAYDLEVYDWLKWELLKAVYNPSDLMTDKIEEGIIDYCISELEDEVADMVEEREEEEERDDMLEELGIDYDKSLGFRERDVVDNLDRVEFEIDNGHHLYKFFHKDGEHSFTWDNDDEKITG